MKTLKPFVLALFCTLTGMLHFHAVHAQCAPNNFTVTSANHVVNTYYPTMSASLAAGTNTISLGVAQGFATPISNGDLLLIIQMQGSTINATNTLNYGDGVAGGNAAGFLTSVAGTYEYVVAANNVATTGGILYLTHGVANSYVNSNATTTVGAYSYQVVRVPRYATLSVNTGASITASAWNGTTGGVVAFKVTGTMTVNGTFVDVSAKGYRGGAGRRQSGTSGFASTDVRTAATTNGSKGEGIAGTPRYVRTAGSTTVVDAGFETYPNGSAGNGAPGNAGGGATDGNPGGSNDQNAGGGGGGNGGAGGRGGKSWSSNLNVGGYGGVAPAFVATSRLVMGGGGGAGSTNDGTGLSPAGISSSGGAGGGLVLIRVGSISGTGTINADGENGDTPVNDGGGGAGAGGSVYLTATTTSGLSGITILARGGRGGNAWPNEADNNILDDGSPEHGPGGGGGGGVVYTNGTLNAASSVAPGLNGTTLTNSQAFGATPGAAGSISQSAAAIALTFNAVCDVDDDNDGIPDLTEFGGIDPYGDADGDGVPNLHDSTPGAGIPAWTDVNGDGINDYFDTDGDGIINSLDLDSDNDGIADITEAGGVDANYDGVVDDLTDSDGDGLANTYDPDSGNPALGGLDSDGDGVLNFLDLDSDNDGIPDLIESGGVDSNGDGRVDGAFADADGDGWHNSYDPTHAGSINLRILDANGASTSGGLVFDFDGDGIPNYLDLDSDGDGIPDIIEQGGEDSDNNGRVDATADVDRDGFIDTIDPVNNTNNAALGTALVNTGSTLGSNNLPASYNTGANFDGTGLINMLDLDSDGDGILDVREAGLPDSNNNGIADGVLGSDGWSDTVDALSALNLPNTDGRGRANYLDIDADDDGITDNVEGQATAAYRLPLGVDADMDGIDDQYDNNTSVFGGNANNGITPVNTDGADLPDYMDTDSDNDGRLDINEGHDFNLNGQPDDDVALTGIDIDGDGLDDKFDLNTSAPVVTSEGMNTGGATTNPPSPGARGPLQSRNAGNPDRDWRNDQAVLPVRFVSLSAVRQPAGVQLTWVVAEEVNVWQYQVERSTDGIHFRKIGEVAFRQGTQPQNRYSYTDAFEAPKVYYRIRQVDIDEKAMYSSVVLVQGQPGMSLAPMLYPNPVNSATALQVHAHSAQVVTTNIADMQGRICITDRVAVQKGQNILALPQLQRLAPGTYALIILVDGTRHQIKFIR